MPAAQFAGLNVKQLADSMSLFEGVARRQEVKGVVNGISVVDDFAHHPTAIKQAILGLAPALSGITHLGHFRTALQHHAQKYFPE